MKKKKKFEDDKRGWILNKKRGKGEVVFVGVGNPQSCKGMESGQNSAHNVSD